MKLRGGIMNPSNDRDSFSGKTIIERLSIGKFNVMTLFDRKNWNLEMRCDFSYDTVCYCPLMANL